MLLRSRALRSIVPHKVKSISDEGVIILALGEWPGRKNAGKYKLLVADIGGLDGSSDRYPTIKAMEMDLTLIAGTAYRLQVGKPGEEAKLPLSMEVGDALRYEGVMQNKQQDGRYSAAEQAVVHCVDVCDNPVSFPPGTRIAAVVQAQHTSAAVDVNGGSGSSPTLDPDTIAPVLMPAINSLPCSGQVSLTLPASVLMGAECDSGTYVLMIDARGDGVAICGIMHSFEYHAERLDEKEKLLQKEIDKLKKDKARRL